MRRVRLSRKKGSQLPKGTVVVSRPSRWGNLFTVTRECYPRPKPLRWLVICGKFHEEVQGIFDTRAEAVSGAVEFFRFRLVGMSKAARRSYLAPLRKAKALACWCPLDKPCHADVLIEALKKGD